MARILSTVKQQSKVYSHPQASRSLHLVGCKLIKGRLSSQCYGRSGVIPLDSTSDVAGPIARTVEDAVRLFEVTVGIDPSDNLTTLQQSYSLPKNYTQFLQSNGLRVLLLAL